RKPDFIRTANNGSFYTTNRANCPESFHGDAFTYYPKHRSRRAAGHAQCERDFSFCSVHSPPRFHCDLSIRDRLSTPAISCRRYNSQRQPLTHFIIRATHSLLPARQHEKSRLFDDNRGFLRSPHFRELFPLRSSSTFDA